MEQKEVVSKVKELFDKHEKDQCMQIFLMDAGGMKDREIAAELNYACQTIKDKKSKCKMFIKNLVAQIPELEEVLAEIFDINDKK